MSIARDATSYAGPSNTTTLTVSHTCTGRDRILFVNAAAVNGTTNVTGVTYNGVSMTAWDAATGHSDAPQIRMRPFYLVNPASGSNTIEVTQDGTDSAIIFVAASYKGANRTQFDAENAVEAANEADAADTITTVTDKAWPIFFLGTRFSGGAAVNGSSVEHIGRKFTASTIDFYLYIWDTNAAVTPAGDTTFDLTFSGSPQGHIHKTIAIKPSYFGNGGTMFY